MKISIKGEQVSFEDGQGHIVFMTTDQLLEMVKTINAGTNQDGGLIFNLLEFTV